MDSDGYRPYNALTGTPSMYVGKPVPLRSIRSSALRELNRLKKMKTSAMTMSERIQHELLISEQESTVASARIDTIELYVLNTVKKYVRETYRSDFQLDKVELNLACADETGLRGLHDITHLENGAYRAFTILAVDYKE